MTLAQLDPRFTEWADKTAELKPTGATARLVNTCLLSEQIRSPCIQPLLDILHCREMLGGRERQVERERKRERERERMDGYLSQRSHPSLRQGREAGCLWHKRPEPGPDPNHLRDGERKQERKKARETLL